MEPLDDDRAVFHNDGHLRCDVHCDRDNHGVLAMNGKQHVMVAMRCSPVMNPGDSGKYWVDAGPDAEVVFADGDVKITGPKANITYKNVKYVHVTVRYLHDE